MVRVIRRFLPGTATVIATIPSASFGSSTIGDPSDVDEGYQIEIEIDLEALGYPANLGNNRLLWMGANLFDADYFLNAHSNNNISPGSPRAVRVTSPDRVIYPATEHTAEVTKLFGKPAYSSI